MATSCGNNVANDELAVADPAETCRPQTPGKMIMSCGSGSAGPLPTLDLAGASIRNPYAVGSVTIDTRGLRCPTVLIHVTALINAPLGAIPSLTFRVTKCCNGCSQSVGSSLTSSSAINTLSGKTFEFQMCDSGECCGCCTYTVEISNATLIQAGTSVSAQVSAIAVEKIC